MVYRWSRQLKTCVVGVYVTYNLIGTILQHYHQHAIVWCAILISQLFMSCQYRMCNILQYDRIQMALIDTGDNYSVWLLW